MNREMLLASVRAEPGRWLLSISVIALGIALVTAIHTLNHSAMAELDQAARVLAGNADLRVEAGRTGFADSTFASVVNTPGVAAASPVLEVDAVVKLGAGRRNLRLLGLDLFRVAPVHAALMPIAADGEDRLTALQPHHVFLNTAALQQFAVQAGDALEVNSPGGPIRLRIAGTVGESASAAPLAVMDIAALQQHFAQLGRLSRIEVRTTAGVAVDTVLARLQEALPAGVLVTTPDQTNARTDALSRGYRANLTVLALVALFTGGFLVFSVAALSVVRRRSELGLLRVLGVTRGELCTRLLLEGAVAGSVGTLLGMAAGLMLAKGVLRIFASDLGAGYFAGVAPTMHIDAVGLGVIAAIGLAAGTLGTTLPAWEASRRPPARALKSGDDAVLMQAAPDWRWGTLLLLLALPLLLLPPWRGIPVAGYLAIAGLLFGTLTLLPAMLGLLAAKVTAPSRLLPQLSWQQLTAMPGYAVSGLATVIVSFSLVAAMAVMVNSFRASVDQWLSGALAADVYVRSPGGISARLPAGMAERLALIPGITRSERARYESLLLDPTQPPVTLIARTWDAETLARLNVLASAPGAAPPDAIPVWVSEAMQAQHDAKVGSLILLPLGGRKVQVWVAGVWRDYARTWGAVVMDIREYSRVTGDTETNDMALTFGPGTDLKQAIANIRQLDGGERLEIAQSAEIRKFSLAIFDRTFAVTYALELAALIVGLAGIAAHFASLAYSRRKEFGVLRHLGFTRRDLGRLLALEGAVTGAAGAGVGLLLGFAISLILIHVVNRQSFHWGMTLHPPWWALLLLTAGLVLLAALAARWAGRAAMQRAAVLAVKAET